MYLHERIGKHRHLQSNPPYLIVVEHKFGRCWTHQVPNKGVNDDAHWAPKRVLQDIENSGLGKTRILFKSDSVSAFSDYFVFDFSIAHRSATLQLESKDRELLSVFIPIHCQLRL